MMIFCLALAMVVKSLVKLGQLKFPLWNQIHHFRRGQPRCEEGFHSTKDHTLECGADLVVGQPKPQRHFAQCLELKPKVGWTHCGDNSISLQVFLGNLRRFTQGR